MSPTVQGRLNDLPIDLEAHNGNLYALLPSPETPNPVFGRLRGVRVARGTLVY